jgi:hypothetical protein
MAFRIGLESLLVFDGPVDLARRDDSRFQQSM